MFKFRNLCYIMLVLILAVGFVSCDNDDNGNGNGTTPTTDLVTITWNNQTTFTVDFYLDGEFAVQVPSGQTATTTDVSKGTHMLMACPEGWEPSDGVCEGEEYNITSDFTYTIQ